MQGRWQEQGGARANGPRARARHTTRSGYAGEAPIRSRRWSPVALLALLGTLALLPSCEKSPRIEERSVFVYSTKNCPVSSEAYSVVYASGDFEPSLDRPPASAAFLRDVGFVMAELPAETRALLVDVSQRDVDVDWRGFADIPRSGPINVLVWPGGASCRLTQDIERREKMALGVFGRHFMVAGGRSQSGEQVPHTYVGDLTTGAIERLPIGLGARRSFASITAFRMPSDDPDSASPALVAGGEDPDSATPLATAEIYMPKPGAPGDIGDFDRDRIDLAEARTRHGSTTLVTGETLLVGGRGPGGLLRTMEIIDPVTRRARNGGVALLTVARERPTVLRLSSGEILVSGGFDSKNQPIPTIEWFAPDASRATKRPVDLVTGKVVQQGDMLIEERQLVPLEAGGALAVIIPASPTATDFKTVWVISAEGALEPGLPVDPTSLDTVRLFRGAEGAPALWTGQRWMRWQPWFGAFQTISDAPKPSDCVLTTAQTPKCSAGPKVDSAITSGDSGLALWLDDRAEAGMNITGYRFATRTRFAAVPKPLLLAGPDQLAPDRLAGFPGSSISFQNDIGLQLGPGASAFLTDVTFADFELEVDVTAAAPSIVLRQPSGAELDVGGASCAFAQAAKEHLLVRRRGKRVLVTIDKDNERECPSQIEDGAARVSLGLRGAQGVGVSGARNLRVTRR